MWSMIKLAKTCPLNYDCFDYPYAQTHTTPVWFGLVRIHNTNPRMTQTHTHTAYTYGAPPLRSNNKTQLSFVVHTRRLYWHTLSGNIIIFTYEFVLFEIKWRTTTAAPYAAHTKYTAAHRCREALRNEYTNGKKYIIILIMICNKINWICLIAYDSERRWGGTRTRVSPVTTGIIERCYRFC